MIQTTIPKWYGKAGSFYRKPTPPAYHDYKNAHINSKFLKCI